MMSETFVDEAIVHVGMPRYEIACTRCGVLAVTVSTTVLCIVSAGRGRVVRSRCWCRALRAVRRPPR